MYIRFCQSYIIHTLSIMHHVICDTSALSTYNHLEMSKIIIFVKCDELTIEVCYGEECSWYVHVVVVLTSIYNYAQKLTVMKVRYESV